MPLPSPKGKEKQSDFVSRCMGDNTMGKDFKDQKQRAAVCYSQWKKAKASADVVLGSGENEILIINEAAKKTYGEKKRSELKLTGSEEKYVIVENYKDCPFAIVSIEEDEAELEYCFSNRADAEEMLSLEMAEEELAKKQDPNFLQKQMIEEIIDEKISEMQQESAAEMSKCKDCGYEGEKADKCPKCDSSNYKTETMNEIDDAGCGGEKNKKM